MLLILGCSETGNKNGALGRYPLDALSCDSCLRLLVHSANIDTDLKKCDVRTDGWENGKLLIKLSHENEAEPGAFVEAADGWLTIDTTNKKLFRTAIEEDTMIELSCDRDILTHYIHSCIRNAAQTK